MRRRFLSYAKFNLCLAVLGRRADGYHEIDTILQSIDLADEMDFMPLDAPRLEVICEAPGVPSGPANLAGRALALLKERHGVPGGMRLEIGKRIPTQAGLGGGSSNAACALAAGNILWELGLRDEELESLGAQLGSDVPFFIRGGTQRCRGRGEKVEIITPIEDSMWVIVKPPWGNATADVYGRVRPSLTDSALKVTILLESLAKRDLQGVVHGGGNDLEIAAVELQPGASRLQSWMSEAGLAGIRMAGSGSSWVGYCDDPATARRIGFDGSNHGWAVWGVRSTGRGWIEG